MAKYNIPKLARNKYNYVKGLDGDNYVTQSQMMMATGGSGGSTNTNTFSQNAQLQSAIKSVIDEMIASYDLVGGSYVDTKCLEVEANCYAYTDSKVNT